MRTLIIEDDDKKLQNLEEYVSHNFPDFEIDIAKSYRSGMKCLRTVSYDLVLLDMSMPTYDKCLEEQGGIWEKFAGKRILSEIQRKEIAVKVIVVTMYDKFGEGKDADTLDEVHEELKQDFPNYYVDKVFYNAKNSSWKSELNSTINSMISDGD